MYLNLLMMFLAAGFIGALALAVGGLLGPKKGTENKLAAYESGIAASGSATASAAIGSRFRVYPSASSNPAYNACPGVPVVNNAS